MTPSTTLAATPAILEGYVGPCAARWQDPGDGSWYWTPSGLVLCVTDEGAVRTTQGTHLVRNVRLDLSPLPSGNPSPAFWHVGALVCRNGDLPCLGGFRVEHLGSLYWRVEADDGALLFPTEDTPGLSGVVIPHEALCAIARVVLEL